jgi:hypothetical protein
LIAELAALGRVIAVKRAKPAGERNLTILARFCGQVFDTHGVAD